jgi:competence protein ComEA
MACFLGAGLVARSLTAYEEKIENTTPTPPAERTETGAETRPRSRGTQKAAAVNVLPVQEPAARQEEQRQQDSEPENEWVVYITGRVRRPGVYRLSAGARLFQLVEAAGGLDDQADPVAVNLASSLEDGLHIHVPARSGQNPTTEERATRTPAKPDLSNATQSQARQTRSTSRNNKTTEASGPVNVNRASEEELISLKGIGPALAKNIVKDRQANGPFRTVEDLLRVKGIGAKKLEGLRGDVTVGP